MKNIVIQAITQQGPVRKANEDHILVGRFTKNSGRICITLDHDDDYLCAFGILLVVADGIGGETGGALASKLALMALEQRFYALEKTGIEQYEAILQEAAQHANSEVLAMADAYPEYSRMGCTLSGVCLTPWGFLVFHAGDSRVYRCRHGVLKQLTRDETVAAALVAVGELSYEQAEQSPQRHTLTNCAGSRTFRITITQGPELRDGDIILVCSDGLHDLVSYKRIGEILTGADDTAVLCSRLADEAVLNGGHDNISIILAQFRACDDIEQACAAGTVETEPMPETQGEAGEKEADTEAVRKEENI